MPLAPALPFPTTPIYAVDYPGYVSGSSIPIAITNLGGEKALTNTFRKNSNILELKLRPNDPLAHPIAGEVVHTSNLLLKVVTRRRKRKEHQDEMTVEDPSEKQGEFMAEVVGVIGKTVRYRTMADFQYKLPKEDPTLELRMAMERMDVQFIRNYRFTSEKEEYTIPGSIPPKNDQMEIDSETQSGEQQTSHLPLVTELGQSSARIMPPPLFSRQGIQLNYGFKASPSSVVENYIDPRSGEEKTRVINRLRWKTLSPCVISFSEPNVPMKPTDTVEQHRKQANPDIINELLNCFERRPMWTRQALINQFEPSERRELINTKYLIPLVCYSFSDGPFRDILVKFGYEPRKDQSARIYQRIYFRNIQNPVTRPSLTERVEPAEDTSINPLSHTFDGKVIHKEVASFQLCDLSDPLLVRLVNDKQGLRNEIHERDGFFTTQALDRIRAIVRRKFFTILKEGRICTDEECSDLMTLPSDGTTITTQLIKSGEKAAGGKKEKLKKAGKSNMAKSVEELTAARLRLALARDNDSRPG